MTLSTFGNGVPTARESLLCPLFNFTHLALVRSFSTPLHRSAKAFFAGILVFVSVSVYAAVFRTFFIQSLLPFLHPAVYERLSYSSKSSSPSPFPRISTPPSSIDEGGSEGAVKRRCQASDMAMPSRMSCSEVMIVEMTVPRVAALSRTRVTILLQMSAPPAITSWRPSGMKPSAAFTAMG